MSPSQQQIDNLLELYQAGKYDDAEKLAASLTEKFPKHPFSWKVLGAVLKQIGKINEALIPMQRSVQLSPQDAQAHNNLGSTLNDLGRLEEAEKNLRQAIKLKPDLAEAYSNLGITLQDLGRLEEAEKNIRQAIKLKPDLAEAYNNLGNTLKELNRLEEARQSYEQAIKLKPNLAEAHNNLGVIFMMDDRFDESINAYAKAIILEPNYTDASLNLAEAMRGRKFTLSRPELYPMLSNILNESLIRPISVAGSILSLLENDPLIKDLLTEESIVKDFNEVTSVIEILNKTPLIYDLMRISPLPDLKFERLFVMVRKTILRSLNEIKVTSEFIYFLSILSLHCFINEFVYFESDEEIEMIENLEKKITQTFVQKQQPQLIDVLCLATYRPLHQYYWCEKLKILDQLKEIKLRLIKEPLVEKMIKKNIPILSVISDEVSLKVREQYEENPYPRWMKVYVPKKKKLITQICDEHQLKLYSEKIRGILTPKILVAGCGTGQQVIEIASLYSDCQVTAVDLSFASLAYAQRKTNELEIDNINYLQADILNLQLLDGDFDVIKCEGVLHHMDNPMAGWKVLTDLLKPGGLMTIGLYSEFARTDIVKVREKITSSKVGSSEAEIKKFRELITNSKDYQKLHFAQDFFSLSEFRDLIFHVQEHRFTLLQVKNYLNKLGLKFCGFKDKDIVSKFRKFHGMESDIYDLALWHQFEESNTFTFRGMYQFWCQKP